MSQPTSAVSLRITEEDLALLDARVGLDGARNRSDVVRLAIQEFLHNQPLLTGMKSIRIPLGRADERRLAHLYELNGVMKEQAAQEGLKPLHQAGGCRNRSDDSTLEEAVEASRASTMRRSEYQE